ncbi:hypothetical protein Mgra_00007291 [Meloidogyne graminicola]|uniref:MFS domain-containing protein n=1 Tax=Meloidogyne graminicola TaxID=189291 RepID=A0A8S9ZJD9_9BILA|nr:hypothetical protein Mgra_00007291 [Meloidogyne graminicola]
MQIFLYSDQRLTFLMETEDNILKLFPAKWRATIVIISGVFLQFTLGLVYTFGNILPYLTSYLRWKVDPQQTQGSLIWLQSLMIFRNKKVSNKTILNVIDLLAGFPFSMLTGGYLQRLIGARWGAAFGFLLYTSSLALSYFSIQKSYFLLIVTMGLFSSFGIGVAYNCVLIQCQKWLPHRVGLVSGLVTAGFGSGAFIISPVQTKFINPENLNVNEEGFFTQVELLERVPQLFILLAIIFGIIQFIGLFFLADPIISEQNENKNESVFYDENEEIEEEQNYQDNIYLRRPLLLLPRSSITSFHSHTSYGGIINTSTDLLNKPTAYGQTFIHNDFFLATVNSFAAATNCFSRIFWGAFADRASYKLTMYIACSIGASLMWTLGIIELINSQILFFIWVCAMFSCVGATYSLIPYATHKCFGCQNFGIAYGCVQLSLFISGIITALCSQFLLNLIGFHLMFTIMAFTMIASLIFTAYLPYTFYGSSLTD